MIGRRLLSYGLARRSFAHIGFLIVPQRKAVVIERLGKYRTTLDPGFHLLIPFVDVDAYYHSLKEEVYTVNNQTAITKDNVTISIDGVLYLKITDPYKASYGVGDPVEAMRQLAQTTMRSELGKLTLDRTFEERDSLNQAIVLSINASSLDWGIQCMRYEIKDIIPPSNIKKAMELQAEAERQKRADVLTSEGKKQADINTAEGARQSAILKAEGEAKAIVAKANASAEGITILAKAIQQGGGTDAVKLRVAEQYVEAFSSLAKKGNTMIIPTEAGNVASMVTQALGIYDSISNKSKPSASAQKSGSAYVSPLLESTDS
jgi:regulator of protease activity HflC (stomatin/prohibitin superfamily)